MAKNQNTAVNEQRYSMKEFESYLSKFFKKAVFTMKPQNKRSHRDLVVGNPITDGTITSKDCFYLNHDNDLEGVICMEERDSRFFSTKNVIYSGDVGNLSGSLSMGYVRKPEEDEYGQIFKNEKILTHSTSSWNDPRFYTSQKEFLVTLTGYARPSRYVIKNGNLKDFQKKRSMAVKEFMDSFFEQLKELEDG